MNFTPVFVNFLLYVVLSTSALPMGNDTVEHRIVNGFKTAPNSIPYQALVLPPFYLCGGSILTKRWIVTAAHCTFRFSASEIKVGVGVAQRSTLTDYDLQRVIFNIYHQLYNVDTKDNDIAMLKLFRDLTFSPTVQPIALVQDTYSIYFGASCLVSGFGRIYEDGLASDTLQSVTVPYFDPAQSYYPPSYLTKNMILAGDEGRGTCQGDSGGPLVYRNELIGIVSWGSGCAQAGCPTVFVKVFNYKKWIQDTMNIYYNN